ncbi:hypothetical protein C8R46DRAFT_996401 [Mycena filopes]|nr:hypothetical protein C8R46DRAFT_996401 [Mycena filopes]
MSRGPRNKKKKDTKKETSRRCQYCHLTRDARRFDKHQRYCKQIHASDEPVPREEHRKGGRLHEQTPEWSCPPSPMQVDVDLSSNETYDTFCGPLLPGCFIRIVPHPHTPDPTPQIIPIDGRERQRSSLKLSTSLREDEFGRAPWFPFKSRADFEATEIAVTGLLSKPLTDKLLGGASSHWNSIKGGSRVTLKNSEEMRTTLCCARKYGVTFKRATIKASYQNTEREITFEYRDPWDWITRLLEDETLGPHLIFNSVRKYYCEGTEAETFCERIIDEPNTADTWHDYESQLPEADPYPHCLLPLHFWLDEGLVTKRITMHPMVLRAVCLPGDIRNASGNGGGLLLGYMYGFPDFEDPSNRNTAETLAYAKFKMEVYQRVLGVIFASLKTRSWTGETVECWDNLVRVFHPEILICSLDGKEAAYFNACRAALANHPCPKCLVHRCDLHKLSKRFELRTRATMKAVVREASRSSTKAGKEDILKKHGLHGIDHFLWAFRFSDPYAAYSHDTLHSDDLGKFGHHLWPLTLDVLEELGGKSTFAKNMREFPRWAGLKHFNEVTTVHFADGQAFYDILKSILPCIVQIFPRDSSLVHCIRAFECVRIMTGMCCMPLSRLKRLGEFIKDYESRCTSVSLQYGKNFDFFKQHATSHIVRDILQKGTTNHGSTRPGEGFQQEAAEAYSRTNFKDVAHQMNVIDETQEAVARIRMAIDKYDEQRADDEKEDEPELDETPNEGSENLASWRFGAPDRLLNSRSFEGYLEAAGHPVKDFDLMLRDFIAEQFPDDRVTYEQRIEIRPFKCVHLTYQSLEDWRGVRDIMRCNPSFHGRRRFDSVLFNSDSPGLAFARLCALLRCKLESNRQFDVALVREFHPNKWRPRTQWAGCQVREEVKSYSFLLMDYVIRGALLAPVCEKGKDNLYFLVDTVDADMFLRADQ